MNEKYERLKNWTDQQFQAAHARVTRHQRLTSYLLAALTAVFAIFVPAFMLESFGLGRIVAHGVGAALLFGLLMPAKNAFERLDGPNDYAPVLDDENSRKSIVEFLQTSEQARAVRDHAAAQGRQLYAIDLQEMLRVAHQDYLREEFETPGADDGAFRFGGPRDAAYDALHGLTASALRQKAADFQLACRRATAFNCLLIAAWALYTAYLAIYEASTPWTVSGEFFASVFALVGFAAASQFVVMVVKEENRFNGVLACSTDTFHVKQLLKEERSARELRDEILAAGRPVYAFDLKEMRRRAAVDQARRIMEGTA